MIRRREMYNHTSLKYEAFVAPADFNADAQPVNIIDAFKNYSNPEKRYIFSIYDNSSKVRLENGTSYLFCYQQNGITYSELISGGETRPTEGFLGMGTEINVVSTEGFSSTGIISYVDYNGGYKFFTYTSKTDTKFIGESQEIGITLWFNPKICPAVLYSGKQNGYVIVNNSIAISANLENTNEALWLYAGAGCLDFVAGYNSAIGQICRVKYIHYDITIPFTMISYCMFSNNNLTGEITIPKSVVYISYSTDPLISNGYIFASNNITKITISENVEYIDTNSFGLPYCSIYNFYPLIAPLIKGGGSPLNSGTGVLHIKQGATGYDVAPWTTAFSEIIADL